MFHCPISKWVWGMAMNNFSASKLGRSIILSVFSAAVCLQPLIVNAAAKVIDGGAAIDPTAPQYISLAATDTTAITATFNNYFFTDAYNSAQVSTDLVKGAFSNDPVSISTGNNIHDETDFVIKGRGLNFAFTRSYNSAPSSTGKKGALGYGWTHSYAMMLKSNDFGVCPDCTPTQKAENGNAKTSSITYTDERGGDHTYLVEESTKVISSQQGEFDVLTVDSPSAGMHTLTFRNGVKYVFQTATDACPAGQGLGTAACQIQVTPGLSARLVQIVDPWGNQLNFGYDASQRLATIKDNLNIAARTGLVFNYDASSNLSSVQDWVGRKWTYVVDAKGNLQSYTGPEALTTVGAVNMAYAYAPGTHNLQSVTKPLLRTGLNGQTNVSTTFVYYQNGRTFRDQDALGNAETLDYDLFRKTTFVTDPRGFVRKFEYDTSGRLVKLIEPDGGNLFFTNSVDGLRDSKIDGIGYKTQYSYRTDRAFTGASDTYGNVTREQDALNQTTDTTYGVYDQIASVKDKLGNVISTSFHTSTDSTCKVTGKPDTVTVGSLTVSPGVVKTNVKLRSYCWNSDGTLKSQTDYLDGSDAARTRVSTYTYTDSTHLNVDNVTTVGWDDVSGSTTTKVSYTYDTNYLGRKQTETLQRRRSPSDTTKISLTTTYTYDKLDRVTQVKDAAGNIVVNNFDDNGQLYKVTHKYLKADGVSYDVRDMVTRTFDGADRVLTEADAMGGVTKYAYDQASNVISVTDAENHITRFEYDSMNRRTAVVNPNGGRTTTVYNQRGDVMSITNPMSETTTFGYDQLGRRTTANDPHGYVTTYSYDANNHLTCVIDANAQAGLQPKNSDSCTESRQYDELGRVKLVRDALNGVTATTYNLLGSPLSQVDAEARQYTWAYDGLGRLKSETDFTGISTTYDSDEAGNVWQKTNRLTDKTQFTFDVLNRPTNVKYLKDNSAETLVYNPAGTLQSATNATSVANVVRYTFGYDNLNRMTSKTDSRGRSLGFTYNKVGKVQTKTTYQGSTTRYTYDGANKLVNASNPDYLSLNYQYDAAGRLLSRTMSSGARSLYTYDGFGWLTGMQHFDAVGAPVSSVTYGRDRVGNITSQTAGSNVTNYTLDSMYRLKVVDAPGTVNDEAFTYDLLGNRTTATRGGVKVGIEGSTRKCYVYYPATQVGTVDGYSTPTKNNRLKEVRVESWGGPIESSYTYDNEGQLTTQTGAGAKTLTWDAKGRVATLTASSVTETYTYDPSNHRIKRSGGALGALDYFLEGDHLESVYSGNQLQEKYFRGSSIDELVAGYTYQSGALTPFMFQHDQVMSVAAATKPNGGTQEAFVYWAFGETQSTTGTQISRLKYTGREDDATGLYQYRARYYDPNIGRFISEDPKQFTAGINFYAYVGNNPINYNDPDGFHAFPVHHSVTYEAARNLGYDVDSAKDFMLAVGGVDWRPGSQTNAAVMAAMHTMTGVGTEGTPINPLDAQIYTAQYVRDAVINGRDMALAAHALQDLTAVAHGPFGNYEKALPATPFHFNLDFWTETLPHVAKDFFPSSESRGAAVRNTELLLNARKEIESGKAGYRYVDFEVGDPDKQVFRVDLKTGMGMLYPSDPISLGSVKRVYTK